MKIWFASVLLIAVGIVFVTANQPSPKKTIPIINGPYFAISIPSSD